MPVRGLVPARFIRSLLTFFFFLGLIVGGMAIAGTLLLTAFADEGEFRGDVSVRVAVGDSSFLPIARFASDSPSALSSPALVGGVAELRFETDDRMLTLVSMGGLLAGMILLLYVIWILRSILDRVLAGRPFDPANVRALHTLSLVAVVGAVAMQALQYFAADLVLATVAIQGITLNPPFELGLEPFVVALMLEVLAAIFRHGADLEADQSLTV